jgi:hypothetical protein
MPIHFAIDRRRRLVCYAVEGDATAAEARAFFEAVLSHPDYARGFDFLGDRREVGEAPGTHYVQTVAAEVKARRRELGPCRWAVVVADDAGFGMARMWSILADGSGVDIRPFRCAGEAAAWLGLPEGYSAAEQVLAAESLTA